MHLHARFPHILILPVIVSCLRLADEVEQRTDVRKSGMEGFYANLLTKNVAMGGDVDAHAVSVYTAGSSRQSHVLSEPAAPEAKKSLKFNHAGASSVEIEKDEGYSSAPDAASSSSRYEDKSAPARSSAAESVEPAHKAPRSEAHDLAPSAYNASDSATAPSAHTAESLGAPAAQAVAPPDKKELILSAKDRYLARKRALEG